MYNSELTPYLHCVGVKDNDNKTIKEQHFVIDGVLHVPNSHGLCKPCKQLTYYINELYNELTEEQMLDCEAYLKYHNNQPLTDIEDAILTKQGNLLDKVTQC